MELGRSFFHLRPRGGRSSSIPYHRVLRIERAGALVWERRAPATAPPAPPIERERIAPAADARSGEDAEAADPPAGAATLHEEP